MSTSATDAVGVLQINTGTASSTPLNGTAVHLESWQRVAFVFILGDMASETIDCKVESCDSNGANAASLRAATQLSAHASNNDNKQIVIGVDTNDLCASGKMHVRGVITTGGVTGGTCSIVAIGVEPRYGPASVNDNATVVQVVG